MRKYVAMLCWVLGAGALATSCSSDDGTLPGSTGNVRFSLEAGTDFNANATTKAVDESAYSDKNNYTLKLYQKEYSDDNEEIWTETSLPEAEADNSYTLFKGSYKLKGYYGEAYEDVVASQAGFYSVGETTFTVNDTPQEVTVNCRPTHGKVTVTFGSDMATYFDSYTVELSTPKLAAESKTLTIDSSNSDPWYLLVDEKGETVTATINLTPKEGYTIKSETEYVRTYTLLPNKFWSLNINATYDPSVGNVNISIEIDETTNDKNYTIEIPIEWL